MEEYLTSMEDTIEAIDKYDAFVHKRLLRSFRSDITSFKELLEIYVSHCLRSVSINIDKLIYLDRIKELVGLEYINEKDLEFITRLTMIRDDITYGNNRAVEGELIEFYEQYKDSFYSIYKTIKDIKIRCNQ